MPSNGRQHPLPQGVRVFADDPVLLRWLSIGLGLNGLDRPCQGEVGRCVQQWLRGQMRAARRDDSVESKTRSGGPALGVTWSEPRRLA